MTRFRRLYGESPLHLLATVASLAFCGYVLLEVLDQREPASFLIFFGAAIVLHDLVAFPIYSLLNWVAQRGLGAHRGAPARVAVLNHVRVPVLLSGLALVVWFPNVFALSDVYEGATGLSADIYLGRWLLLTAALFLVSALLYAIRLGISARPPRRGAGDRPARRREGPEAERAEASR